MNSFVQFTKSYQNVMFRNNIMFNIFKYNSVNSSLRLYKTDISTMLINFPIEKKELSEITTKKKSYYKIMIHDASYDKNINKMLSLFYIDMINRDKILPSADIVELLLKNLILRKASNNYLFKIIETAQELELKISMEIYADLCRKCFKEYEIKYFNVSCLDKIGYNKPFVDKDETGIKCFEIWKKLIKRKDEKLSLHYINSLIELLSRLQLPQEAFTVFDYHDVENFKFNEFTLSALIHNCNYSLCYNGIEWAGIIYHLFNKFNIIPTIVFYNQLLKTIELCNNVGNIEIQEYLSMIRMRKPWPSLNEILTSTKESNTVELINVINLYRNHNNSKIDKLFTQFAKIYDIEIDSFLQSQKKHNYEYIIHLISPINILINSDEKIMIPNTIRCPSLITIGGLIGFLKVMQNVKPNIITMCMFLKLLPVDCYSPTFAFGEEKIDFFSYVVCQLVKYYKIPIDSYFTFEIVYRQVVLMKNGKVTPSDIGYKNKMWDKNCNKFDIVIDILEMKKIQINNRIFKLLINRADSWDEVMYLYQKAINTKGNHWRVEDLYLKSVKRTLENLKVNS